MRRETTFGALAVVALLLVIPSSILAQVEGRVLTSDGSPLPAATVEVWGRGLVFQVAHTDLEGRFTLPDLSDRRVTRYVFRYLGFRTEIVQHEDFHAGIEVRLGPEPVELEELRATVVRDRCPRADEAEARDLWTAAAARYNRETSRRGRGAYYRAEMRDVSERVLFEVNEADAERAPGIWESWPGLERWEQGRRLTLEDVVDRYGYAWERRIEGRREVFIGRDRHLSWIYAALDGKSANHFVTPTFAAMHSFSLGSEGDEGTRVHFCPRRTGRDRPTLRGSLLIGTGLEMIEAEWTFATRDPREDAGGWVRFGTAPDLAGGLPHLVASRSLFYRHEGFEKPFENAPRWYFRDLREWSGWVVSGTMQRPASRRSVISGGRR